MDSPKLFEAELKLMELVWQHEPVTAKDLSLLAAEQIGWNKNTTYTIIKKLIEKRFVARSEPGFVCASLVKKQDVRQAETNSLIDRLYNGSRQAFFAALFQNEKLSEADVAALKDLIEKR